MSTLLVLLEINRTCKTVQDGEVPSTILVSTTASSVLSGYFTLFVEGEPTPPIAFDATASDMKSAIESISVVGLVSVTRTYTGMIDENTWGVGNGGYKVSGTPPLSEIHLQAVYPLFVHDLGTYDSRVKRK